MAPPGASRHARAPAEVGEHPDALLFGQARGRGAQLNPGNRYETTRLHVLGEHLDDLAGGSDGQASGREAPTAQVATQVHFDRTRSIINHVDRLTSPDVPYEWTVNPYRGCEHGCVYCYARPDHERLGFSCGLDFETHIVAKREAPALLARELAAPGWRGEVIALSGVTDAYQPVEAALGITRACLQVMARFRQPVSIITKSRLVLRDLDLLTELARHQAVRVTLSVTTLDRRLAARLEPRAASPADRLRTIADLRRAGVSATVNVAPILPGVTDHETPAILQAAADAGAQAAGCVLLRLPHQIKDLYLDWLRRNLPERAAHAQSLLRQAHGGRLYDCRPGLRQHGQGPIAQQIHQVFTVFRHRYGLDRSLPPLSSAAFRRGGETRQLPLFAADPV